jgi:hypothetical protein
MARGETVPFQGLVQGGEVDIQHPDWSMLHVD